MSALPIDQFGKISPRIAPSSFPGPVISFSDVTDLSTFIHDRVIAKAGHRASEFYDADYAWTWGIATYVTGMNGLKGTNFTFEIGDNVRFDALNVARRIIDVYDEVNSGIANERDRGWGVVSWTAFPRKGREDEGPAGEVNFHLMCGRNNRYDNIRFQQK